MSMGMLNHEIENFGHMHISCLKTRFYYFINHFDYLKTEPKSCIFLLYIVLTFCEIQNV